MTTQTSQARDATVQFTGSHYPVLESWLLKLSDCGDWAKELSRWYESDWQLAAEGGRRPEAEQVLMSLDETQRSIVKPVFDSIDAHYDSRMRRPSRPTLDAGNDATVQLPATKIPSSEVIDAENNATMEFSVGSNRAPVPIGAAVRGKPDALRGSSSLPNIPGYRIEAVLGRGGMGVVYAARQLGIDRSVAIKMVLAGIHSSRTLLDRFLAEAKAVGKLKHENIVQIYDSGWHDKLPYFSLEFVDGPALSEKLSGQPMDPIEAAQLVKPLANALQYAHSQGIIHRDVKPANVWLDSAHGGKAKLLR